MKKRIFVVILLTMILTLAGCATDTSSKKSGTVSQSDTVSYYDTLIYQGEYVDITLKMTSCTDGIIFEVKQKKGIEGASLTTHRISFDGYCLGEYNTYAVNEAKGDEFVSSVIPKDATNFEYIYSYGMSESHSNMAAFFSFEDKDGNILENIDTGVVELNQPSHSLELYYTDDLILQTDNLRIYDLGKGTGTWQCRNFYIQNLRDSAIKVYLYKNGDERSSLGIDDTNVTFDVDQMLIIPAKSKVYVSIELKPGTAVTNDESIMHFNAIVFDACSDELIEVDAVSQKLYEESNARPK